MKMQQTHLFNFLTLLISSSFLLTPALGQAPLCKKIVPVIPCMPGIQQVNAPVSLQRTLELAYMQNAAFDQARATLRAADENVAIAISDWRPSISAQGIQRNDLIYRDRAEGNETRHVHTHTTTGAVTIAQNIYKGGATVADIEQQKNLVFSQKADLFTNEQQTLFNAVQAHASVIAQQDIVKYRQESVAFFKKFLEHTQARFEVGEVTRADVEASLSEYERAKGDLSEAIGNLEEAKAAYFQIVACPPENLAPANILLELPKTYEDALYVAKDNNPRIKANRFSIEAAIYNVNVQIAGLLPTLDVSGTVEEQRTGGTGMRRDRTQTQLIGLATLNVPIYAQGIPNAKIRQAYQLVAEQKVRLVQTVREVEQDARTSWEQLLAAREALKGYMAAVKAGEIAVEGASEEANVGLKSIVDVLQLQNDLIASQISLVTSQEQLVTRTYSVLQAMGSLMASTLKLNVRYYDADAYYNEYKDAWFQFWQSEDWRYVKNEPCGPICTYPPR